MHGVLALKFKIGNMALLPSPNSTFEQERPKGSSNDRSSAAESQKGRLGTINTRNSLITEDITVMSRPVTSNAALALAAASPGGSDQLMEQGASRRMVLGKSESGRLFASIKGHEP